MQLYLRRQNQAIVVKPWSQLQGGEGYLCAVTGRADQCIKIYSDPVPDDLEDRLEYLIDHPPATILDQIAWPEDIVEDGAGQVIGYLQTHFGGAYEALSGVISTMLRPPWASPTVLRQIAYDVALVIAELHAQGYLFPDLHCDQFLAAPGRKTVLIDTGSVQFQHGGRLFACDKVRAECQGPEFLGTTNWSTVADQRDVHTDSWSLNTLIFQLAMECYPFDGIYVGTSTALPPPERAKHGFFPYDKACRDYRPPTGAPPYRNVHPELRDLFQRCFVEGHQYQERTRRPTANEWADVLRQCTTLRTDTAQRPMATAPQRPKQSRWAVAATLLAVGCGLGYGLARLGDFSSSPSRYQWSLDAGPPWWNGLDSNRSSSGADAQQVINRLRTEINQTSEESIR